MQGNSSDVARSGLLAKTTPEDKGRISVPKLTPHLEFHNIGNQQVLLVSEFFNTLLQGQLTIDLLPLLNGECELSEIVVQLKTKYAESAVHDAIAMLSSKGYVISGEFSMERARAAYWTSLGATPRYVEQTLTNACVHLEDDAGHLKRALQSAGVHTTRQNPRLSIYICADYLEERFRAINESHLASSAPWLLVRPRGVQPLFGPIFSSGNTGPCWSCLSYRLRNHQEVHSFLRHIAGEDAAFKPFAAEPLVSDAVTGTIASEILKWLVFNELAPIHQHALSINTANFETSKHQVRQRPQCHACGDESLFQRDRKPHPLVLKPSLKTHRNSGGTRTVAPEVTLAKYRHLVSPISGVISWLRRTTDESDSWLHVYWAGSNLGARNRSLSTLRRSLRSKSAGKGSTREQSEASALCEAVERYSGALHDDEIRVRKSFDEFASGDAIHPNDVQLFSDEQLNNAPSINAQGHPYNIVPKRFDANANMDWTPVWSLSQHRHKYLPTSMLYSMSAEQRHESDLFADSNGCAAGNTLEEAILQGFYELVERDAFAIWWYNQLQVPEIDLASFDDEFLTQATEQYAQYDREVWLLDVTSDLGIPSFVAVSRRMNSDTEDLIYGAGAHDQPRIAALRAICELNQCLTWLPRPSNPDGRPMIDDPLALSWWKTARLDECRWLVPKADRIRVASDFHATESTDSREDLIKYCGLLSTKGMELLVLDQTRPDIGMPVVRVMVPGLRHFWARFAAGRLYDVPVSMGHRTKSCTESELNPSPVIA